MIRRDKMEEKKCNCAPDCTCEDNKCTCGCKDECTCDENCECGCQNKEDSKCTCNEK